MLREDPAFLAEIRAFPGSEISRLIYADWLDERGESERADLIRADCAFSKMEPWDDGFVEFKHRHRCLRDYYDEHWRAPFAHCVTGFDVERGFVNWVGASAPNLVESGESILAEIPIHTLGPTNLTVDVAKKLAMCQFLRNVRGLYLSKVGTEALNALLESRYLHDVEYLNCISEPRHDGEALRRILQLPAMAQLKRLTLSACLTENAAEHIVNHDVFAHLESLKVEECRLSDHDFRDFLTHAKPGVLRDLELSWTQIGSASLCDLAASTKMTSLRSIKAYGLDPNFGGTGPSVPNDPVGTRGLAALANSPILQSLECLDLGQHESFNCESMRILAAAYQLPKIKNLRLVCTDHNATDADVDAAMQVFFQSPLVQRLKRLDFTFERQSRLSHWVASMRTPIQLKSIRLQGCCLTNEDAKILADSPRLANLTVLQLFMNEITDDGAIAILDSPNLRKLHTLGLTGTDHRLKKLLLSHACRERIRQRFGDDSMP